MHKSKLIELLKTFSTSELREFKDFVGSPFFNKNKELILFYDYLKKIAPVFPLKKIHREYIYANLFKNKKYDEKHLNYLMSFLLKLAEEYIGITKYKSTGILPDYHILSSCLDRQLNKHYQNYYQKAKKKLDANPICDIEHYYQNFLLAQVSDKHFGMQKIRRYDANIQAAADNLDLFYLTQKLKYACEMLDREKTLSVSYQQNMLKEITLYLEHFEIESSPAIAIYYHIYLTLTKENGDPYFEKLKVLLNEHTNKFSQFELKEMYLMALNFCIRKVRKKDEHYVEEAFVLFKKGIENRSLYENDLLSPWTFKNVIKLGLRLKQFDWIEGFIKKYKDDLDEEIRENALNYNLADLYYYKKELGKAQDLLQRVEFSDVFYALSSKVILLKIYYEKKEDEALYSLLASFKVYLHRNKVISNNVRKSYLNFISLLNQIIKGKLKNPSVLKEKIINTELLTARSWLLEILEFNDKGMLN